VEGWSSTAPHAAGGEVRFEQSTRPPAPAVGLSEAGARKLADAYWREIEAFTRGLVRARKHRDGIELLLLGRWTLLCFGGPETLVDGSQASSRFPILGGALARAPGGSISFVQTVAPELELRTTVDGFLPRLAGGRGRSNPVRALAWRLQCRLHVAISRRYLMRLVDGASR
jgi:hypothetical protein